MQSGRMHIRMDDGQEGDIGPGDIVMIPPGHDAWVIGGETCVFLDLGGMEHYAERVEETGRRQGASQPSQPSPH